MTENDMAFLTRYRALATQLGSALKEFQSSASKFQVVQTIDPSNPSHPQRATTQLSPSEAPSNLIILDSSFNPPSTAHKTLITSALQSPSISNPPSPYRLLLLFSTQNADKAPSPAPFDQRLLLITLFASDILLALQNRASTSSIIPAIDIALTTAPYYTDKSAAISASHYYARREGRQPTHTHLIGFDTATRFFNPKYYPSFTPPLSALRPYFAAGHSLRVTLRPDEAFGSVEEQRVCLERLGNGELEAQGGRREWAELVRVVEANAQREVSSTRIREAARSGEWGLVRELCTPGVARWVESEGLYAEGA